MVTSLKILKPDVGSYHNVGQGRPRQTRQRLRYLDVRCVPEAFYRVRTLDGISGVWPWGEAM